MNGHVQGRSWSARLGVSALVGAAGLCVAASSSQVSAAAGDGASGSSDSYTVTGVLRVFRASNVVGGHPDFKGGQDTVDGGLFFGMIQEELDEQAKPVFASRGFEAYQQWQDSQGRPIMPPRDYVQSRQGDIPGSVSDSEGDALTTAENFAEWFRDVPGRNTVTLFPITLERVQGTDIYRFDDRHATQFADLDGFYAVNEKKQGKARGGNKIFHFTYELGTEFVYHEGQGQYIRSGGAHDVWVFVDDKLVIDLGGIHSDTDQYIDLDRLDWLEDGKTYRMKVFYAQRQHVEAHFRLETNFELRTWAPLPTVTALHD